MLDYSALKAVALVVQTGSFEKAARILNVTPSAVSQRIKHLEERMGTVLIERGSPCVATDKGDWLCRHMEQVSILEQELLAGLPGLSSRENITPQRVTLHIATNADSLGTWFLKALSHFSAASDYLFNIAVDDQDHTAEWLRKGRVVAAVTSLPKPVQGCRLAPLGVLQYRATASPEFIARHFPDGITRDAIARAPSLTFNQKDRLQDQWVRTFVGGNITCPTHWLPSTQAFVEASLSGMGWGMNPDQLVSQHLESGQLVELIPDTALEIPLFWQVNRLAADRLASLTQTVLATARSELPPFESQ